MPKGDELHRRLEVELTHLDQKGQARMVDVAEKEVTLREARAEAWVWMKPSTLKLIFEGEVPKGDVLSVSRVAGIMAAKRTAELIPLCHPLGLTYVGVEFFPLLESGGLRLESTVRLWGRTGAEMEALVAVAVSALTVYDMIKAIDRGTTINGIRLLEKSGGKSGHWSYSPPKGEVVAVNLAAEKCVPKRNVGQGFLRAGFGLEGDAHAGSERQLSIFPLEALAFAPEEVLKALKPDEYSENITIRGLPLEELRVGRRLRLGEAEVEIVQIGKGKLELHGRPWIVSREGRFASVLKDGSVKVGDPVELL